MISPGSSIGTLSVGEKVILRDGSIYLAEIDGTDSDLLVAREVEIEDGAILEVTLLGAATADEYKIIETTDGIDQFFTVHNTFLYEFAQEFRDGQNELWLLRQRSGNRFADVFAGLGMYNPEQAAIGVDGIVDAGLFGNLDELGTALGRLTTDAEILDAFVQLHGEVFASGREATAQMQRRFLRQLPTARDRALKTSCDPCGAANSVKDWNRWATFTGDWLNRNDIGNFSGYDLRTAGVAFGMDKNVTKKLFVGAAFGYDDATLKFDTLRSKFDDDVLSTGLEIGRKLRFGQMNLTPSIGLHYIHLSSPSATETRANGANLYVHGGKYDSLRLPVGARINRDFRFNTSRDLWSRMTWTPELRAFYVAELADDSASVRTAFNNVRSIGFTASSGHWGRSSGVFGVGLKGQLSDRLSLRVDYDHEVYEHTDMGEFSVSAGVNW